MQDEIYETENQKPFVRKGIHYNRKQYNFMIDKSIINGLWSIANNNNVPLTEVVNKALQEYVINYLASERGNIRSNQKEGRENQIS